VEDDHEAHELVGISIPSRTTQSQTYSPGFYIGRKRRTIPSASSTSAGGALLRRGSRLPLQFISFPMLSCAANASASLIDHEFGDSHTYFHSRAPAGASHSPPANAIVQETGVTTWMTKLSESSYAYHSKGRACCPVVRSWPNDPLPSKFIPNAQWQTRTESTVSFHATGVHKQPQIPQKIKCNSEKPTEIVTTCTESSISFHSRSAI
jgi:hypothetical protein